MQDFHKTNEFLSKKNNVAIIRALLLATQGLGFNALLKEIQPITPRILSQRLSELEKTQLIQKNLVLGQKPKIEYRALPKSEGLRKEINELEAWGNKELS